MNFYKKMLVGCCFLSVFAEKTSYDIIIIGDGPAGCSAAIYCGNAGYTTAIFSGQRKGGQLALAGIVENMPGVEPLSGGVIADRLEAQARSFGAVIIGETITQVTLQDRGPRFKLVSSDGQSYFSSAIVLAMGARPRTLGIPGESEFWGNGVSTCAICDGHQAKDKDIVIVGGGDTAIEEALQLSCYARTITLLVRDSSLAASPRMQEKLAPFHHINYRYNVEVKEICGNQQEMSHIVIYNRLTQAHEIMKAEGLFLAIGHIPETNFIQDIVACDRSGHVILVERQKTSVPGIFAAGDVADYRYRQAVVATGDGAKAALDAIAFLRGIEQ